MAAPHQTHHKNDNFKHQCISCKKEIEMHHGLPNDAVVFKSSGNYGSALFDPMDGSVSIQIYVCDDCLKEHQANIVLCNTSKQTITDIYYGMSFEQVKVARKKEDENLDSLPLDSWINNLARELKSGTLTDEQANIQLKKNIFNEMVSGAVPMSDLVAVSGRYQDGKYHVRISLDHTVVFYESDDDQ